ncbi:hypothetical protein H4R99_005133 [Coemansia sp. RSA 1722]|nr:hypothetical protein LPJ57_001741 [Coemansia sp. RSA 486]KAJ2595937.1 hypothetical protein H4R99_005133 [Coemansia sp. RSA 1722]
MKFAFAFGISGLVALSTLHFSSAAPVDLESFLVEDSSFADVEGNFEIGTLDQDEDEETNVVTIKVGFFSYINSVFNDMVSDNILDSSEISELINDWNSELSENIVYESEDDEDMLDSFTADQESVFDEENIPVEESEFVEEDSFSVDDDTSMF